MNVRLLRSVVPTLWGQRDGVSHMHKHTKLTPVTRRAIYEMWVRGHGSVSLRVLAAEYHVDKRVIGRIIERGRRGDFSVHDSTNVRYQESTVPARRTSRISKASITS